MHAAIVFLLILSASVASEAGLLTPVERDVIKKEYAVRPGGTLHLDMDRGNIEVEVGDENRVFIELERVVKADDKRTVDNVLRLHEYTFNKKGNDVQVSTQYNSERGRWHRFRRRPRLRVNLTVRVPEVYNVNFENGAGNVEVTNVGGSVEGSTGAGNVIVDDITGDVKISTGAGNIDVSGDVGSASVETGAGNIDLYGLEGAVRAVTGAGNIDAVILHQPDADSKFSTGAGNVMVALAEDVGIFVDASTSLGSADCDFPVRFQKSFLSTSFSGKVNGGGAKIAMSVGMGNVTLKRH